MATAHPTSGPPPGDSSPPTGRTYLVTTRELSVDFATVGPEQGSRDLGAIDGARFLSLLEKLVALDVLTLVNADPQVFVTVKSGRFLIQPQGGKLLVRPVQALDQIFFKLSPAEIPPFLDGVPMLPPTVPPTTLIGSAEARAKAAPPPASDSAAAVPVPPNKLRRALVAGALVAGVLLAGSGVWFFFLRAPAPKPPARAPGAAVTSPPAVRAVPAASVGEFDPVTSPTQLAELKKRVVGNYATGGDVADRLLELRADGTFRYQEFGANLAPATSEKGAYTFELRRGTSTPVIRAAALGVIELRDENSLVVRGAVVTRFSMPDK